MSPEITDFDGDGRVSQDEALLSAKLEKVVRKTTAGCHHCGFPVEGTWRVRYHFKSLFAESVPVECIPSVSDTCYLRQRVEDEGPQKVFGEAWEDMSPAEKKEVQKSFGFSYLEAGGAASSSAG